MANQILGSVQSMVTDAIQGFEDLVNDESPTTPPIRAEARQSGDSKALWNLLVVT